MVGIFEVIACQHGLPSFRQWATREVPGHCQRCQGHVRGHREDGLGGVGRCVAQAGPCIVDLPVFAVAGTPNQAAPDCSPQALAEPGIQFTRCEWSLSLPALSAFWVLSQSILSASEGAAASPASFLLQSSAPGPRSCADVRVALTASCGKRLDGAA